MVRTNHIRYASWVRLERVTIRNNSSLICPLPLFPNNYSSDFSAQKWTTVKNSSSPCLRTKSCWLHHPVRYLKWKRWLRQKEKPESSWPFCCPLSSWPITPTRSTFAQNLLQEKWRSPSNSTQTFQVLQLTDKIILVFKCQEKCSISDVIYGNHQHMIPQTTEMQEQV